MMMMIIIIIIIIIIIVIIIIIIIVLLYVCFHTYAVVLDAYPNTATVKQGTTLVLVCRVVGVPSTTVLSYQWTCPGGSCDAGAVDPEWAAKVQQGNILVVNVRRHDDGGSYNCTVWDSSQQVGADSYLLTVAGEYADIPPSQLACHIDFSYIIELF